MTPSDSPPAADSRSADIPPALPWDEIDTVFLDMDGTLLDLHFDNVFWRDALPDRYAAVHGLAFDTAQRHLLAHMAEIRGTLDFYSVPYWSNFTGLDLVALKHDHAHLIDYLPEAEAFLIRLRSLGKRRILASNAHPDVYRIKNDRVALDQHLDGLCLSHDLGAAKESTDYWEKLVTMTGADPRRSVMIDDNETVLAAAHAFGIGHVITVSRPDTRQPIRAPQQFPNVEHLGELRP